jgi:hypothetical protein
MGHKACLNLVFLLNKEHPTITETRPREDLRVHRRTRSHIIYTRVGARARLRKHLGFHTGRRFSDGAEGIGEHFSAPRVGANGGPRRSKPHLWRGPDSVIPGLSEFDAPVRILMAHPLTHLCPQRSRMSRSRYCPRRSAEPAAFCRFGHLWAERATVAGRASNGSALGVDIGQ